MEIREGIKYKILHNNSVGEIYKIVGNEAYVFFNNNASDKGNGSFTSIIKKFKDKELELIEYPYKVGDWVYDINDEFTNLRNKILQISKIDEYGIWCLDRVGESYSFVDNFNKTYRPCFAEEIEVKEVKLDYSYLKEMLNKLNL